MEGIYRMKIILNILIILLLPAAVLAQYQIKVSAVRPVDSIVYIRGAVFDDKNFIPKDTIRLNGKIATLNVAKPIIGGVYFFYFPISKQKVSFILENKDTLSFRFIGSNYLDSMVTNTKKNKTLQSYQQLENKFAFVDSSYAAELTKGKKFNLAQKAVFFKSKTDTLIAFRKSALARLQPADALHIYFAGLNVLDASVPSRRDYVARSQFIKNFSFLSPKFLFTPIVRSVLTEYFSYYPLQADSISKGVDTIMKQVACSTKIYPYVFDYFTKLLKNREIQNNTEAYAGFIEKYVNNKPCALLDKKVTQSLTQEAASIRSLKLLDTCANMMLPDTTGIMQDLHVFAKQHDYTVLIFYDPTCSHCQVELPKMDSVINVLETKYHLSIGKYAVCNDGVPNEAVWKQFIIDYKLSNKYTHVKMQSYSMDLRKKYDAFTNPLFYLISKSASLLGKKISPNTLQRFIFK